MFCLPVLHLTTHLSSERHPGTSHQLLQQGMCILLHTFFSQRKGQITVIRRPLLNEVSLVRKICKVWNLSEANHAVLSSNFAFLWSALSLDLLRGSAEKSFSEQNINDSGADKCALLVSYLFIKNPSLFLIHYIHMVSYRDIIIWIIDIISSHYLLPQHRESYLQQYGVIAFKQELLCGYIISHRISAQRGYILTSCEWTLHWLTRRIHNAQHLTDVVYTKNSAVPLVLIPQKCWLLLFYALAEQGGYSTV